VTLEARALFLCIGCGDRVDVIRSTTNADMLQSGGDWPGDWPDHAFGCGCPMVRLPGSVLAREDGR
jgi:hypothetical protein